MKMWIFAFAAALLLLAGCASQQAGNTGAFAKNASGTGLNTSGVGSQAPAQQTLQSGSQQSMGADRPPPPGAAPEEQALMAPRQD